MTITAIPYTPPEDTVTALADISNQAQTTTTVTDLAGIVANTATTAADTPVTTTDASGVTITNTTIDGLPAIITTTPANPATGAIETSTVTLLTSDTTAIPAVTDTPVTTTPPTGTTTDTVLTNTVTNTTTDMVTPITDTVLIDPAETTITTTAAIPETMLATQPAPVITDLLAQDGATQNRVFDGSRITDTAPVLKGTAMPGVELGIFDNGQLLGKTTADDNWAWSFQPQAWKDNPTAATGLHVFTAAHLNADDSPGLTSVYSYTCAINADPRPLLVPVITEVKDDIGTSQGNALDLTMPLDDTAPEFQGTSQPGTLVTLYDNGVKVLETTTGSDWLWHAALTDPLAAGNHTFTVQATYPDGLGVTAAPYQFDCTITAAGNANTVDGTATTPAADIPADLPAVVPNDVLDTSTSLDQLLANAGLVAEAPVTGNTTTVTDTTVQALSLTLVTLPQPDLVF